MLCFGVTPWGCRSWTLSYPPLTAVPSWDALAGNLLKSSPAAVSWSLFSGDLISCRAETGGIPWVTCGALSVVASLWCCWSPRDAPLSMWLMERVAGTRAFGCWVVSMLCSPLPLGLQSWGSSCSSSPSLLPVLSPDCRLPMKFGTLSFDWSSGMFLGLPENSQPK